jgi:hypothetical protein
LIRRFILLSLEEEEEEEEDAATLLKRMKRIVAFHSPPLFSVLYQYQQPPTNIKFIFLLLPWAWGCC